MRFCLGLCLRIFVTFPLLPICRRALLKPDSAWLKSVCGELRYGSLPQTLPNPRLVIMGIKKIKISLKTSEGKKFFCLKSDQEGDENLPLIFFLICVNNPCVRVHRVLNFERFSFLAFIFQILIKILFLESRWT